MTDTAHCTLWVLEITNHTRPDYIGINSPGSMLDGHDTYWIEGRASEGGRNVIVRRAADGTTADLLPRQFNARTSVHEYGGGDYVVSNGAVYFSNFADQRVYRVTPGDAPTPITPEAKIRYADYIVDQRRNRFICVREDHTDTSHEAVNTLVSIALDGSGHIEELVAGNDFYSTPRLSPDEAQLAWLTWKHPEYALGRNRVMGW